MISENFDFSTSVPITLLLLMVVVIIRAIAIVPQQNIWIVGRLGQFYRVLSPSPGFFIPFIK